MSRSPVESNFLL